MPLGSFSPHSPETREIAGLFLEFLILAGMIFLIVAGLLNYIAAADAHHIALGKKP